VGRGFSRDPRLFGMRTALAAEVSFPVVAERILGAQPHLPSVPVSSYNMT
jgi:hypothetical protein